jgi:hypothetical protein
MATAAPFKTFMRGSREQVPEESYAKGMSYSTMPLQAGFCYLLVNYDLKDNGDVLIPRPALNNYTLIDFPAVPLITYTNTMLLVAANTATEDDGVTYQKFILGDSATGKLHVLTNVVGATNTAKIETLSATARFRTLASAEVHGIELPDLKYTPRHIGTFAFNNDYYYFDNSGLCYTKFDEVNKKYITETITPKVLYPSEAVMWGYNMLRSNPYTFTNTLLGADSPIFLDGVLPYDDANNLALSPKVNQTLHFECFYRGYAAKSYKVVWEWKEPGSANWSTIKTEDAAVLATDKKLLCDFKAPDKTIMLRVTATNNSVPTDMQVLAIGFDFSNSKQGNAANSEIKIYDLKNASSMTYWKNRLVVALNNMLFIGEINDPGYMPYPNNVEPFQEDIIHVTTYMDALLVFTTSKLYSISLGTDGLSWYVKCIQGNLNIKEQDIHLIQMVKNMVFFKSGNYYYMVVPKASSTTGELTIAPVSKSISPLLDEFQEGIDKLLKLLYDYTDGTSLLYYYNFLDFEDVHNVYVFQTTKGVLINVDLLYNTVLRVWRVYLFESQHLVKPFRPDATTKGTFMTLTPIATKPCVQLLQFSPNPLNCADSYVAPEQAAHELVFKNYQLLDTGYRALYADYKKRFREIQLKFNNRSNKTLNFHTEFSIDGDTRKSLYKYTPKQELDPQSPNYGLLTMERTLIDPSVLPGTTILGSSQADWNYWALSVSQFPETALWKIRIPVSGKGYCPRMTLVSYNLEPYELLSNTWVFRELYSR